MKFLNLIVCALCAGMALICAVNGYSFAAGLNLFASILNAGNFIMYMFKEYA